MKSKLKVDQLDSIKIADYLKDLKIILKKALAGACTTPETAVQFFVKMDHTFADGVAHPLILFSKMDPNWKKWAKDQLKGNKKMLLSGTAYLKVEESGFDTLMITPLKGTAKLDKIVKQSKSLLKRAKVQLALATPTPEEQPQEVSSQTSDETTTTTTSEENTSLMGEAARLKKQLEAFLAIPKEEVEQRRNAAQPLKEAIDAFLIKAESASLPQLAGFIAQIKPWQSKLATALAGTGINLKAIRERISELLNLISADYKLLTNQTA